MPGRYRNDDLIARDFSPAQKSILVGSVLGDGNLYWQKGCRFPRFINAASRVHADYGDWKMSQFSDFRPSTNKGWSGWQFYLSPHPFFAKLYSLFYPTPKHLSAEGLALVDDLALAVWFMDDGCLIRRSNQLKLATHSFSCAEHLLMQKWFESRWSILPTVKLCDTGIHCLHVLHFPRVEADKLRAIIDPYIIPSMRYKIGC